MDEPGRVLARSDNCVFLDLGPLFVGLFWGDTNLEQGKLFNDAAELYLKGRNEPYGVMTVVASNSNAPSGELRTLLRRAIERVATDSECFAGVILGSGVKATSLRAIMGALLIVLPRLSRARVCSTVDQGIDWVAKHLRDLDVTTAARIVYEAAPTL